MQNTPFLRFFSRIRNIISHDHSKTIPKKTKVLFLQISNLIKVLSHFFGDKINCCFICYHLINISFS
ncbi:hypothetical protein V1478_018941 [Vespula squamosa]|uniref:Uncharacterized protein n=1 Tax=Vespula squamosa TaxID=30214 RepID=A0ABD1ZVB3_VESSQ